LLVGYDVYDAALHTDVWNGLAMGRTEAAGVMLRAAAWAVCIAGAAVVGSLAISGRRDLVPALVPLAVGSFVAHYLPIVLVDGLAMLVLLADPFAAGWSLPGLNAVTVTGELLPRPLVVFAQASALVAGGVLSIAVARDRTPAGTRVAGPTFPVVVSAATLLLLALRLGPWGH
jgi:hypothetical protein